MIRDRKKIELYEERSFNENINTLFSFAKQNKRVLFKLFAIIALITAFINIPIDFAIQNYFSLGSKFDTNDIISTTMMLRFLCVSIVDVLFAILFMSIVFAFEEVYFDRTTDPTNIKVKDIIGHIPSIAKRLVVFSFIPITLICALYLPGIVVTNTSFDFFAKALLIGGFVFFTFLILSPTLVLLTPCYVLEDISLSRAISKSIKLGFYNWLSIIGFVFTIGLIFFLISLLSSIPFYIIMSMQVFTGVDASSLYSYTHSSSYNALNIITQIVSHLGYILWVIFFTIGTTLVYGATMEKTEYKSIDNSIDIFEQLNNDIIDQKLDEINDIDISSED
ncbi:hypothetical protein [Prevotella sp. oral taxon 299]|uniref:hypothetical protein n=1 Tax=Prevotella sp. oral taxon 299 TaxID=652716 RepID=UPI00030303DB|nr:hypothetical protein [Prevotella sp. oral taxon 299]EFC71423.2 hypothetical protein HMPREF0669_00095 [Prevotella sp. oral taxon 299 str. F0039]